MVVVSRRSELDELLARHGTRGAAAYFLRQRGRDLDEVTARHEALRKALTEVGAAVPADWRRGHVERADLPRFLFGPEDIVVAVGPGRPGRQRREVPRRAAGDRRRPGAGPQSGRARAARRRRRRAACCRQQEAGEERTMVVAPRSTTGRSSTASTRSTSGTPATSPRATCSATPDGGRERQSSSGLIVGTGTGATGWCASIARERGAAPALPAPGRPALCWFVREAWPSPATGVQQDAGLLAAGEEIELTSESERLVVFADGLESGRAGAVLGSAGQGRRRGAEAADYLI